MARPITEVVAGGKSYYICQSELDIEGEATQLYWDTRKGSGMNKMPSNYRLHKGEIVDYFTGKRISKYDLAEFFSSQA